LGEGHSQTGGKLKNVDAKKDEKNLPKRTRSANDDKSAS